MREVQRKGIKINFPKENLDMKKNPKSTKEESHYNLPISKQEPEEIGPCALQDPSVCYSITDDNVPAKKSSNHNNNNRKTVKPEPDLQKQTTNSADNQFYFEEFSNQRELYSPSRGKLSLPGKQSMFHNTKNGLRTCSTFPSLSVVGNAMSETRIQSKFSTNDRSV